MARSDKRSSQPTHSPPPQQRADAAVLPFRKGGPTHEQIARRAFEIYCERGGVAGSPEGDWIQAERELSLGYH